MPPDVVPSKYIVPSPPFAAVMVVLPQNVPPPLAITVAGNALIVRLALVRQPVDNIV